MRATNLQLLAITVLSSANIWLAWWDVRWLTYSRSVSSVIPGSRPYASIDIMLELPAALILLAFIYVIGYQSTYALWKRRFSNYRSQMMTNALIINSLLLVILTAAGIAEWLLFYGMIPLELIVVVSLGAVAALMSAVLEKQPRWPRPAPYADILKAHVKKFP